LPGRLFRARLYIALYNSSDAVFYLRGFFGNPYNVPLGAGMDYWLPTAPNSAFVFPTGQAISRTTYATLFAAMSTTYGVGDGSTTFNLPDKRGRVSAGVDTMGGSAASRLTDVVAGFGDTLGEAGGGQSQTLTLAQLPTGITSTQNAGFNVTVATSQTVQINGAGSITPAGGGASNVSVTNAATVTSTGTVAAGNVTTTSSNTSGNAHPIVQPTIVCNYILRII
jgi:microcystin-dependent protein